MTSGTITWSSGWSRNKRGYTREMRHSGGRVTPPWVVPRRLRRPLAGRLRLGRGRAEAGPRPLALAPRRAGGRPAHRPAAGPAHRRLPRHRRGLPGPARQGRRLRLLRRHVPPGRRLRVLRPPRRDRHQQRRPARARHPDHHGLDLIYIVGHAIACLLDGPPIRSEARNSVPYTSNLRMIMPVTKLPLPDGQRTKVFRQVEAFLRNDPVLSRVVRGDAWKDFSGDPNDAARPAPLQA